MTSINPLTDRLLRLAQAFQQLKERVRDAVALEMGKVVSDAVRGWITTTLQTHRAPPRYDERDYRSHHDGWDDPDDWHEPEPIVVPPVVEPTPKPTRWAAAVSIGVVAARWFITRRVPLVASVGAGALTGLCAFAGGPLVQSAISAVTAAAELTRIARPEQSPAH